MDRGFDPDGPDNLTSSEKLLEIKVRLERLRREVLREDLAAGQIRGILRATLAEIDSLL